MSDEKKEEQPYKTLIDLLGIDREKARAYEDQISNLIATEVEPNHNSVAALLVVAARAAAAHGMPFVLACSLVEWLYNQRAKELLEAAIPGIIAKPTNDPSMH